MPEHPATITYSIPASFPQALKSLRSAFVAQGLKVSKEVNISNRIRQNLMIGTDPCVVLLVSPLADDACASGLTPMHVVVSSHGSQTEVHVLRILPAEAESLDIHAKTALNQVQSGILHAVEKIGMRVTLID